MGFRLRSSWWALLPALLMVGCTVGVGEESSDSVRVTIRAQYEKRPVSASGMGAPAARPARYAYARLYESGTNVLLTDLDLGPEGTGTATVPRGVNVYAAVYADVLVPNAAGNGYALHGNVKKALLKASYATGTDLDREPTWGTSSDSFLADTSGTLTVRALDSTSEAGAFAIADQMVELALGFRNLEPSLPLPNYHAFWAPGTGSTLPLAATNASGALLTNPTTQRPMLVNEFWYGGPGNGAEAYNESLLLETFARGLSAYGSTWGNTYGSILRGDNDAAFISPWISSESTLAFTSGFASFLSCALRNDPNLYVVTSAGALSAASWRLDVHDFTPVDGGEFYASAIARSQWGAWKQALSGSLAGLQTLWNATLANQPYEYGNAPLGCYPTYLVGLKRLVGSLTYTDIQTQLNAENVGKGLDVTQSGYFNSETLWKTIAPSSVPLAGSLTTYDNNQAAFASAYYDRVQAQAYRVQFGDGSHTLTVSTSSPGVIVELFDSLGYYTALYATSAQSATKTLTLKAGTYAVRVRVDPYKIYSGTPAGYSLTVN